jgi:uncharacterized membrane protein (UPF0127 family)
MSHRGRLRALLQAALLALSSLGVGVGHAADLQPVEIGTSSGVHVVMVELAATETELTRGLKGREELPAGRGMLFDFRIEQHATMSMKDTPIALDMVFIRGDGRVVRVEENTQPMSDRQIYSGGPVRGVLELPAGTARLLGIRAGDRVSHRIFTGLQ